jgi:hypothetical protein
MFDIFLRLLEVSGQYQANIAHIGPKTTLSVTANGLGEALPRKESQITGDTERTGQLRHCHCQNQIITA